MLLRVAASTGAAGLGRVLERKAPAVAQLLQQVRSKSSDSKATEHNAYVNCHQLEGNPNAYTRPVNLPTGRGPGYGSATDPNKGPLQHMVDDSGDTAEDDHWEEGFAQQRASEFPRGEMRPDFDPSKVKHSGDPSNRGGFGAAGRGPSGPLRDA